jgi:hypothetical protein
MNEDVLQAAKRCAANDDIMSNELFSLWMQYVHSTSPGSAADTLNQIITKDMRFGQYVVNNWVTYKDHFLKYIVDQHMHLGLHVTSPVEKQNDLVKLFLDYKPGTLCKFFRSYSNLMKHQHAEVKTSINNSIKNKPVTLIDKPMFHGVCGFISHSGLQLAEEEYKKAISENDLPPCTSYVNTCFGIPCAHTIRNLMQNKLTLTASHFHEHWRLPSVEVNRNINKHNGKEVRSFSKTTKPKEIQNKTKQKIVGRGRIKNNFGNLK